MLLYPFSFLLVVLTLSLWFFVQKSNRESKLFPTLFYLALGTWAVVFFLGEGTFSSKIPVLVRDLILMAGIPLMLQNFAKNKAVFFGLLFLLIGVYFGFGWDIWAESFHKTEAKETTSLEVKDKHLPEKGDTNFELLAEIKNGRQLSELKDIAEKYGLSFEKAFDLKEKDATELDDYVAINIPNNLVRKVEKNLLADLQSSGLVDWVEANEIIKIDDPVTDLKRLPAVNRKFGVNDPALEKQWAMQELNADKLYAYLKKNKIKPAQKARIFILDTGVDATHEDLKNHYRSFQEKYDKDLQGHGTHCAGIAAAVTNNSKGIASLTPNSDFVEITSVKVLSDFGGGTQRGIINGMLEAADAGADVISMSLGGRSTDKKQRAYRQAVDYANEKGAIVIVAAGNSNANAKNFSPAGAPGVICVAAIDTTLNRANFSNFVQDVKMGIAAPGTMIYSTFPGNQYKAFNGTSMATPYVAGLVGLMKSIKPELTTKEVYKILEKTGKKTQSDQETGRFIQPEAAIRAL